MNRNQFLKTAALAGAGVMARPFITYSKQARYRTVLIGSGWWGTNIVREAIRSGEVQITAICDVDDAQLKKASEEIGKLCDDRPKHYKDFRECIQKEKPEIVINATPDHWHALIAIEAMKNGAHVFLEKPIGHTVKEGTAIQKTARDTQRICIVDFHRRYSPHNVSGMEFLKSGKAGLIKEVRAFVHYNWGPGNIIANAEPPKGLDWDMWVGPAPATPYNPSLHPRGFRQFKQFANGNLGDWGPHWFDQILWWTEEKAPKKIYSSVTEKTRTANMDAPESQIVVFEFEGFNCTWEHSILNRRRVQDGENVGVYFHGTEGTFHMGWQKGWSFYPNDPKKQVITQAPQLNEPDQQNISLVWADLLKSIKSGQLPHADVEHGRQATNMCLLGMISSRVGRSIVWDHEKDTIVNDPQAAAMLTRQYRDPWKYPV